MTPRIVSLLVTVATLLGTAVRPAAGAEPSLLGQKAPGWSELTWVDAAPRTLAQLEGKVVLIRWWTAPHCPYCRATAPALNEFQRTYGARGLQVLGFYHHKSPEPLTTEAVKQHAQRLGFEFPIAIDPQWRTLRHWWLDRGEERWTSVSFLLDRRGVVRHIHPGGEYVKGDADYAALQARIEALLTER